MLIVIYSPFISLFIETLLGLWNYHFFPVWKIKSSSRKWGLPSVHLQVCSQFVLSPVALSLLALLWLSIPQSVEPAVLHYLIYNTSVSPLGTNLRVVRRWQIDALQPLEALSSLLKDLLWWRTDTKCFSGLAQSCVFFFSLLQRYGAQVKFQHGTYIAEIFVLEWKAHLVVTVKENLF